MPERLISGDNHIDMTYCPRDRWSERVRRKSASENVVKLYNLR
jgi:hypothetical protein